MAGTQWSCGGVERCSHASLQRHGTRHNDRFQSWTLAGRGERAVLWLRWLTAVGSGCCSRCRRCRRGGLLGVAPSSTDRKVWSRTRWRRGCGGTTTRRVRRRHCSTWTKAGRDGMDNVGVCLVADEGCNGIGGRIAMQGRVVATAKTWSRLAARRQPWSGRSHALLLHGGRGSSAWRSGTRPGGRRGGWRWEEVAARTTACVLASAYQGLAQDVVASVRSRTTGC